MKSRKDKKGIILRKGEGQLKNGKYYYQYYDIYNNRKKLYASTLKELRQKQETIMLYKYNGIDVYNSKILLKDYIEKYLRTKQYLNEKTLYNYQILLNKFVYNSIGKKHISSIVCSDLKIYFQDLLMINKLSISTLNSIYSILNPTFNMAIQDKIILTNPSTNIIKSLKKQYKCVGKKKVSLSINEQKHFIKYITNTPEFMEYLPLFIVLLGTGGRIGEVLALTYNDVDFQNKNISINKTVSYIYDKNNKKFINKISSVLKTSTSYRVIPMISEVYNTLIDKFNYREKNLDKIKIDGYSKFIFLNKQNTLYTNKNINEIIKRIIVSNNKEEILKQENLREYKANILPDFTAHSLRHTFCTRLCEQEVNIKVIQSVMGHSSIQTTMDIYAEANQDFQKKVFNELDKMNIIL